MGLPTIELWPALAEPEFTRAVRAFATESIAPVADEIDARDFYPSELVKELAQLGVEEVARHCGKAFLTDS